jgi:hypothetical protein
MAVVAGRGMAVALGPVMAAALGPVMAAALGPVMAAALGPVMAAALGQVMTAAVGQVMTAAVGPVAVAVGPVAVALGPVAVRGAITVTLHGVATVTGFITADVFSARVLASMAMATRGGGIGTIRVIPIMLTPTRTTIHTMAARTMATRTTIRITKTVILTRPLPRGSKSHSHGGAIIGVGLTVRSGRRLAMQFDHSRPIKVYR